MSTDGTGSGSLTVTSSGTVRISVSNVGQPGVGSGFEAVATRAVFDLPAAVEASSPFQYASTMRNGSSNVKVRFS